MRKFGKGLSDKQRAVFEWFNANGADWERAVIPPLGMAHGDFRTDKSAFVRDARRALTSASVLFSKSRGTILIDWATVREWSCLQKIRMLRRR
jgi:hypothetical protein